MKTYSEVVSDLSAWNILVVAGLEAPGVELKDVWKKVMVATPDSEAFTDWLFWQSVTNGILLLKLVK